MFKEWNKPREDTPFRGTSSRLNRKSESGKKAWNAAEANMNTFQVTKNTVAEIAQRIEKGRMDRFLNNSAAEFPLPHTYLKNRTSFINHLQTDHPRPPPFPFLKRPIPPPFPLPTFDESSTSLDMDEISEVPKITSVARDISKSPRLDPRRYDLERVYLKPLETKTGKVNCNVNGHDRHNRQMPELAQQVLAWKMHLREKGMRPSNRGPPVPIPRRKLRTQQTSLTDVFGLTKVPKKADSTTIDEDEANLSNYLFNEDEYESGTKGSANKALEVTTVFKISPKLVTVQNRTLCNVEQGIRRIENSKARIGNQSRLKKFF